MEIVKEQLENQLEALEKELSELEDWRPAEKTQQIAKHRAIEYDQTLVWQIKQVLWLIVAATPTPDLEKPKTENSFITAKQLNQVLIDYADHQGMMQYQIAPLEKLIEKYFKMNSGINKKAPY